MQLKSFKRSGPDQIELTWDDGHQGTISLRTLREACPCAGCQGESVLLHHYAPTQKSEPTPQMYQLTGAETIGSYAIQLQWADGHNTGIYTWQHLRALCECPTCQAAKSGR